MSVLQVPDAVNAHRLAPLHAGSPLTRSQRCRSPTPHVLSMLQHSVVHVGGMLAVWREPPRQPLRAQKQPRFCTLALASDPIHQSRCLTLGWFVIDCIFNHSNFYRSSVELVVICILTRNVAWTQTLQLEGFITKIDSKTIKLCFLRKAHQDTPWRVEGKFELRNSMIIELSFRGTVMMPSAFFCVASVLQYVASCFSVFCLGHRYTHKHTTHKHSSTISPHLTLFCTPAPHHSAGHTRKHTHAHTNTQIHTNLFLNNLAAPHTFLLSNSSASVFIVFSLEGAKR